MIEYVTTYSAIDRLTSFGFSYEGASSIVARLEEWEEESDSPYHFDACAVSGEWNEYKSLQDFWEDQNELPASDEFIEEFINYHGELITFDGGIIVSAF